MYVGQPIKAKINFIGLTAISSLKATWFASAQDKACSKADLRFPLLANSYKEW